MNAQVQSIEVGGLTDRPGVLTPREQLSLTVDETMSAVGRSGVSETRQKQIKRALTMLATAIIDYLDIVEGDPDLEPEPAEGNGDQ